MKKALITILGQTVKGEVLTEISMPFNEFVLYRADHYKDEEQILIICSDGMNPPQAAIPDNLKFVYAGSGISRIRKTIKRVVKDCENKKIPYAIHLHECRPALIAQFAMLGTGLRKKTLFTVHSTFPGYRLHNKVFSFMDALFAQMTTCVSNESYRAYPQIIKKIKKDRIRAVQNGVDAERIDNVISNIPNVNDDSKVNCIYVARLVPIKNHEFLIEVLKKTPPSVHFTFVGASDSIEDSEKSIRRRAKQAGVADRITFTGFIPRIEVFRELKRSDIYISSSTLEGLPISVLEAMYCGLPCILSDIPQHREVIGVGKIDSVKLLPFDADAWVKAISEFAYYSAEERQNISARSREFVRENFSLEKMHKEYSALYDTLRQIQK